MALKTYKKQDDIPEALREFYKQDGKLWVPDLDDSHPLIAANRSLEQDKGVVEAKVTKLQSDLDTALDAAKNNTSVPRGQALVAKADAELLEKVKAHGTADEIAAKLTEHSTLKESETKRKRDDNLRLVAGKLGFNPEAFIRLPNLPEFQIKGSGDKEQVVALVKDGENTVEKPAAEFMEASADHAPFLPALKAKSEGVEVHGSTGTSSQPADPFQAARDWGKQYNETNKPQSTLTERFHLAAGN